MSLLEKVQAIKIEKTSRRKIGREYTPKERAEVVVAWFKGELTLRHIGKTLGYANSGSVSHIMSGWAREAYENGYLVDALEREE